MNDTTIDYNALVSHLTDPDRPLRSAGQVTTGAAAAEEGRAFLLREYGSDEAIQTELRRGRPRIGEVSHGPSPSVRGRLSAADYAAFQGIARQTGRSQSDLVREAVHDLITRYRSAS